MEEQSSAYGADSGFMSMSSPPQADDSWSLLPVILFLLLCGSVVIAFVVAAGAFGDAADDDSVEAEIESGGSGGGGGGVGGGSGGGGGGGGSPPLPLPIVVDPPKPSPRLVPPRTLAPETGPDVQPTPAPGPRDTPPPVEPTPPAAAPTPPPVEPTPPAAAPTPPAAAPTPPTAAPTPPPAPAPPEEPVQPRKELICTVGDVAAEYKMYPRDGLCHYLFYTHVFVYANTTIVKVHSTSITASFRVFQEVMARSRKTQGGLSFDAAATNKTYAKRVRLDLTKLAKKKIIHYGSLNVFEVADKIKDRVTEVIETMKEFKKIQKNDPNKRIVVAIGGVEYSSADAWAAFKESIMMAADKDTGIDTVIAISSTNQLLTDQKAGNNCIVVPPNTIHSSNMNFPTLARNLELVNEANQFMYGNRDAVVGLSLEMGAMMYTFSSDQELSAATAYKECKYATLVTLDMGCSSNPQQIVRDTVMGFGQETRQFVIVHDNKTTLERKFKYVLARHPRKRFAWLYFDVNMADFVQSCGLRNPFEFLQTLRTTFGIHDKPDDT